MAPVTLVVASQPPDGRSCRTRFGAMLVVWYRSVAVTGSLRLPPPTVKVPSGRSTVHRQSDSVLPSNSSSGPVTPPTSGVTLKKSKCASITGPAAGPAMATSPICGLVNPAVDLRIELQPLHDAVSGALIQVWPSTE